jgi:hypothetical protein
MPTQTHVAHSTSFQRLPRRSDTRSFLLPQRSGLPAKVYRNATDCSSNSSEFASNSPDSNDPHGMRLRQP